MYIYLTLKQGRFNTVRCFPVFISGSSKKNGSYRDSFVLSIECSFSSVFDSGLKKETESKEILARKDR